MRALRLVRGLLGAPRMENVIALLLLVFLSWVQGAGATERPSRRARHAAVTADGGASRVGRTSGSCASSDECAWGHACVAGVCAEAPCHGAKRVGGRVLAARRCGSAAVCSYVDGGASRAHGVGVCVVR